ncbi:MAG TPA: methylamine utilization protein [Caulobacteraceae bacterium]|nr:methylamine utilization protein [Caulobacteraceae bacterium]
MRGLALLFLFLLGSLPARAADLAVEVRNAQGKPVPDAVATLYPAQGARSGPIHFDWPMEMVQQDLQFHPFVLIVPAGAVVAFPNRDDVRHHVYSFSPAHPFELKLYGRDETRTVRFDHPGAIALGCNIHDNMIAFIKVVDTPYAAKSGADGVASLRGAPPGQAVLHVWHPYLRAAGNEIVRTITLPRAGGAREIVVVELRNPPPRDQSY